MKRIISEPFANNPSPNKTLAKLGFKKVKTYRTIPGSLNFEQEVNRWEMDIWAKRQEAKVIRQDEFFFSEILNAFINIQRFVF